MGSRSTIKSIKVEENQLGNRTRPSMEAMSEKRRRLSPAASEQDFFDHLPDSVIEEILLRLPFASVFCFRCVSKRCLSLTTSPRFIHWFQRHHASLDNVSPLLLLVQNSETRTYREFFVGSRLSEFKFFRFSLDFLPGICMDGGEQYQYHHISVMGSCDDLLLCSNRACFQREYFIVNPITRHWVALPPTLHLHKFVLTGFVCDPTSISEARKGGKLRYRVVRMPLINESKTKLEIYSSDDERWNEYTVPWAEQRTTVWWSTIAVACNGSLYWRFHRSGGKIMSLDPFNPEKKELRIIQDPPDNFLSVRPKEDNLGICGGKLTLCRSSWSSEGFYEPPSHVKIWELKEEGHGRAEWQLVQKVSLQEIIAGANRMRPLRPAARASWVNLGVHPGTVDIVYFACTETSNVVCCNLKNMSLEAVGGEDLGLGFGNWGAALLFVLPCWPTPLLPNQNLLTVEF